VTDSRQIIFFFKWGSKYRLRGHWKRPASKLVA